MTLFVTVLFLIPVSAAVAILTYIIYDSFVTIKEINRVPPDQVFLEEYQKIKSSRENGTK